MRRQRQRGSSGAVESDGLDGEWSFGRSVGRSIGRLAAVASSRRKPTMIFCSVHKRMHALIFTLPHERRWVVVVLRMVQMLALDDALEHSTKLESLCVCVDACA